MRKEKEWRRAGHATLILIQGDIFAFFFTSPTSYCVELPVITDSWKWELNISHRGDVELGLSLDRVSVGTCGRERWKRGKRGELIPQCLLLSIYCDSKTGLGVFQLCGFTEPCVMRDDADEARRVSDFGV